MPRTARRAPGGYVYHVLNRGNGRAPVFDDDGDYAAFERVLAGTLELFPAVRLLAYCLMPNHWHLLLWPRRGGPAGQLGAFMQRLTVTHVRRWHAHRHSDGGGHLYQGPYKSFPVQGDRHFWSSPATSSATPCGPGWPPGPRTGGGPASGAGSTGATAAATTGPARPASSRSSPCRWPTGPSSGRRTGSSGSTARRPRPRRRPSAQASGGVARSGPTPGSGPPPAPPAAPTASAPAAGRAR
jgi:REP element-mobilizing transposase RayT